MRTLGLKTNGKPWKDLTGSQKEYCKLVAVNEYERRKISFFKKK